MNRLEQVLIEIEQQTMPVLVVSHVSVLQASRARARTCVRSTPPPPPSLPGHARTSSHRTAAAPRASPPSRAPFFKTDPPIAPTPSRCPHQVLLCYFRNIPVREAPHIEVPLHTVIELQPTIGGPWVETRTELVTAAHAEQPLGMRVESSSELYQGDSYDQLGSPPSATTLEPPGIGLRKSNLHSSTELTDVATLVAAANASPPVVAAGSAAAATVPAADIWSGRSTSPHLIRHAGLG